MLKPADLDPSCLTTLNALDAGKVARLVESMKVRGWAGRRLLVEENGGPLVGSYAAWTGSHRVAAAIEANLRAVPCVVLPWLIAQGVVATLPYRAGAVTTLLNSLSTSRNAGGLYDQDRVRALRALQLDELAELLELEIQSPEG